MGRVMTDVLQREQQSHRIVRANILAQVVDANEVINAGTFNAKLYTRRLITMDILDIEVDS